MSSKPLGPEYAKCEQCGGLGAHRTGCPASYDPTDKHWITCTCGNNVFLLPVSNYMVDDWGGCHVYNACGNCPLDGRDTSKLVAKVVEVFGEHPGDESPPIYAANATQIPGDVSVSSSSSVSVSVPLWARVRSMLAALFLKPGGRGDRRRANKG